MSELNNESGEERGKFTRQNIVHSVLLIVFLIPLNYALWVTLKPSLPAPSAPANIPSAPATATQPEPVDASWGAAINEGLGFYNSGNYAEAIKAWQKAIAVNPKGELAYNNIGSAYGKMGDWESQKTYCEKALAINPDFPLAKANLQEALVHLKVK